MVMKNPVNVILYFHVIKKNEQFLKYARRKAIN